MDVLLRVWSRLRTVNPLLVDGVLAAALSVAAAAQFLVEHEGPLWKLPLVLAICLAVVGRRRYPIVSSFVAGMANVAALMSPPVASYLAFIVIAYSIGVHSRRRLLSLGYIVASQVVLLVFIPEARPPIPDRFLNLLFIVGLWLAGNAVRSLSEGMGRLQRERELSAQVAAGEERARIARELHDVVAHSVSVMVVQAGAARQVVTRQPERASEALQAVEAAGREALTELRSLLGLLHSSEEATALAPRPGLDQLEALAERTRAAGLPLQLHLEGRPRTLAPGLDLAAYRIVQEALTNALKYSGRAPTEVTVRYGETELALEVRDRGRAAVNGGGTGRGLVGMRERVGLYGGELEAGPGPDGGYVVRARLPLEPPA